MDGQAAAAASGQMQIGMAAPWGVGKTSLVTALLDEANRMLAGTAVSVQASGPTQLRLDRLKNEMRGHLRGKEFVPGGISGTQEISDFTLNLKVANTAHSFALKIMDYPGGLLESQEGEPWQRLTQWLQASDVLILPVDAAMIMEAVTPKQHSQVESVLNIASMERLAGTLWAKQRAHSGAAVKNAGMLVLAPVKCESYFADNGGMLDKADELYREVVRRYTPVLEAVWREAGATEVVYCPIDTLGCVEVVRVEWDIVGAERPRTHYRVRGETRPCPKGGADLFSHLARRMLAAGRDVQGVRVQERQDELKVMVDEATRDDGLVLNFWRWLSGRQHALEEQARRQGEVLHQEFRALQHLEQTMRQVAEREVGGRVRLIAPW
ncbi:MAG: hypothetical protein RL026_1203 [Pseudomonadota bacterium]|jgi:hypothetical protein